VSCGAGRRLFGQRLYGRGLGRRVGIAPTLIGSTGNPRFAPVVHDRYGASLYTTLLANAMCIHRPRRFRVGVEGRGGTGILLLGKAENMRLVLRRSTEVVRLLRMASTRALSERKFNVAPHTPLSGLSFRPNPVPDHPRHRRRGFLSGLVELSGPAAGNPGVRNAERAWWLAIWTREPKPQLASGQGQAPRTPRWSISRDGILDIIVSESGHFTPTDRLAAGEVWLRGHRTRPIDDQR